MWCALPRVGIAPTGGITVACTHSRTSKRSRETHRQNARESFQEAQRHSKCKPVHSTSSASKPLCRGTTHRPIHRPSKIEVQEKSTSTCCGTPRSHCRAATAVQTRRDFRQARIADFGLQCCGFGTVERHTSNQNQSCKARHLGSLSEPYRSQNATSASLAFTPSRGAARRRRRALQQGLPSLPEAAATAL